MIDIFFHLSTFFILSSNNKMIDILTKEIANIYDEKIHDVVLNKYCVFNPVQSGLSSSLFLGILLVVNNYISFIVINNLIKNLLSLACQYSTPKYENLYCQTPKKCAISLSCYQNLWNAP